MPDETEVRLGAGELAEHRLATSDKPVEVFFEQIGDSTQKFGTAIRHLRDLTTSVLNEDRLTMVVLDTLGMTEAPQNRDEARQFKRKITNTKKETKPLVVFGRASAQAYSIFDENIDSNDDPHNVRDKIKNTYAHYFAIANDENELPIVRYEADSWVKVFEAQKDICEAEKELYNDLRLFLGLDPQNIVELLSYIGSEQFDIDEYKPFLRFFAKNMFDPFAENLVENRLADLSEKPEHYVGVFCDFINQCFSEDDEVRQFAIETIGTENIEWVNFVRNELVGADSIGDYFAGITFEEWPEPLRLKLVSAHEELLRAIHNAYKELLRPHVDTKDFFIDPDDITVMLDNGMSRADGKPNTESRKANRRQNSRSSIKSRPDSFLPEEAKEDERKVTAIASWSLGTRGFITSDTLLIDEDERPIRDILLDIPQVKSYLKGRSDPKIEDDVVAMLESLLSEPYGNGANKLNARNVSLEISDRHHKQYSKWHLNPNKRTGLTIGDTGRNTRIDFVPYRDENGEFCIAIIDVGHKNDLVKTKGHSGGN